MPRERRRRRRRPRAQARGKPVQIEEARGDDSAVARGRPWRRPTLAVVMAFSGGLWIGATLSFADWASGVGLLVGVLGLALGGARLVSNRIRRDRLRAARARRESAEAYADGDDDRDGEVS